MSAKNRLRASLLVLSLVCTATCASVGDVSTTTPRKFTRVNVVVDGLDAAQVEAVLIDRDGRRTGWTRSGEVREINGCINQPGWGDDFTNPRPDESDSAAVEEWVQAQRQDSIYAASAPPPTSHFFEIGNDMNYRAGGPVGLIDQGGCELRLDPIYAGAVALSLRADGTGFRSRRDTTSTVIVPGRPQRWRMSWKTSGDSCIVKIERLDERGTSRRSR